MAIKDWTGTSSFTHAIGLSDTSHFWANPRVKGKIFLKHWVFSMNLHIKACHDCQTWEWLHTVLRTGSVVCIRVERPRANAGIPSIAVFHVVATQAQSPAAALERKVHKQYPDSQALGACRSELVKFSLLWRLVRDLTVRAEPGGGHQCFKQTSSFVRFCISPKAVKFGLDFKFQHSISLHIQILSLSPAHSSRERWLPLTASSPAPKEFALFHIGEKKEYIMQPKRGLVSHSDIC